jgi:hypothetical protein
MMDLCGGVLISCCRLQLFPSISRKLQRGVGMFLAVIPQLDTIALRISMDRSTPNLEQKLVSMPQSATTT